MSVARARAGMKAWATRREGAGGSAAMRGSARLPSQACRVACVAACRGVFSGSIPPDTPHAACNRAQRQARSGYGRKTGRVSRVQAAPLALEVVHSEEQPAPSPTTDDAEYVTHPGQELKLVGSLPELGGWNVENAPSMTWQEGHRWMTEITLPPTSFDFKVVVMEGDHVKWEQEGNRIVQVGETEGLPLDIFVQ
eukprot:gene2920-33948_t